VEVDALPHNGADHGVQAGAVTSAVEDADAHGSSPYRRVSRSLTALAISLAAAAGVAGCGARAGESRIHGHTLTIYSSQPMHGVSGPTAAAVAAGESLALSEAGSRAAHHRVRLVRLDSTRPGGRVWEPALVSANANRAADDTTAIAYLGDLDYGASAVSVPLTNEKGILQISPADGLTSLTTLLPSKPQAGPARYYPTDVRSFLRLTPSDLRLAKLLLARARDAGAKRLAVVYDGQIYGRELASELVARARRDGPKPVVAQELGGDATGMPDLVKDLSGDHPDAIVYAGVAGPLTQPLFEALARGLPNVPVFAAAGVLARRAPLPLAPAHVEGVSNVPPVRELSPPARRVLRRIARRLGTEHVSTEALSGYESMRLALAAIDRGGANRKAVLRAGMRRGAHTQLVPVDRFYLYRLSGGRFVFDRELR
jgi:branched-chain amino acid transport system substrate-binding protein